MPPGAFTLDHALLKKRFAKAAANCQEADVLAREIARRMDERLDYIRVTPQRIADLGCGCGDDLAMLARRYPQAQRFGVDFALPMLERARGARSLMQRLLPLRNAAARWIGGDMAALPLADGSMSMVWSNLALPWIDNPLPSLREAQRVLEEGGMLMFATLGPDTLKELRAALPAAQGERVHRFIDMHDIGDALVHAGFADPVMDMEMLTLTYADADGLFRDLRRSGCNNASRERPRGLSGKAGWTRARENLETLRRDDRLPVTFEIIYGHAWKISRPDRDDQTTDGRSILRFHPRQPADGHEG